MKINTEVLRSQLETRLQQSSIRVPVPQYACIFPCTLLAIDLLGLHHQVAHLYGIYYPSLASIAPYHKMDLVHIYLI